MKKGFSSQATVPLEQLTQKLDSEILRNNDLRTKIAAREALATQLQSQIDEEEKAFVTELEQARRGLADAKSAADTATTALTRRREDAAALQQQTSGGSQSTTALRLWRGANFILPERDEQLVGLVMEMLNERREERRVEELTANIHTGPAGSVAATSHAAPHSSEIPRLDLLRTWFADLLELRDPPVEFCRACGLNTADAARLCRMLYDAECDAMLDAAIADETI